MNEKLCRFVSLAVTASLGTLLAAAPANVAEGNAAPFVHEPASESDFHLDAITKEEGVTLSAIPPESPRPRES